MKQTLITLLGSIVKAAVVSAVFAFIAHFTKQPTSAWFFATLIGQFILFYLYGMFLEYRSIKDRTVLRLKELELLSKITFTINCAACKQPNEVTINANEDNKFTCEHCNAKNAVYVNVESALVTDPISAVAQ
jgi:Zn finger protein HypA/HybF involved in hydrogenase expression